MKGEMSTRISHFTIGWDKTHKICLIPVMARSTLVNETTIYSTETPYESAKSRESTLYLVNEDDFLPYECFKTFKIDEQGKGIISWSSECWIVNHLIICNKITAISGVIFHLRHNVNKEPRADLSC